MTKERGVLDVTFSNWPTSMRRGSEVLREVAWVIFDEVHYMQVGPLATISHYICSKDQEQPEKPSCMLGALLRVVLPGARPPAAHAGALLSFACPPLNKERKVHTSPAA
jgi:hypothetical protein